MVCSQSKEKTDEGDCKLARECHVCPLCDENVTSEYTLNLYK